MEKENRLLSRDELAMLFAAVMILDRHQFYHSEDIGRRSYEVADALEHYRRKSKEDEA